MIFKIVFLFVRDLRSSSVDGESSSRKYYFANYLLTIDSTMVFPLRSNVSVIGIFLAVICCTIGNSACHHLSHRVGLLADLLDVNSHQQHLNVSTPCQNELNRILIALDSNEMWAIKSEFIS